MSLTARIRVRYPARPGDRLVLRTSADWHHDLVPVRVEDDGTTFLFDAPIDARRPSVAFKACRHRDGRMAWSHGPNGLAWPGERSVYPHFDDGISGRITDRFLVGDRDVRVYLPPGYDENTLKRYPVLYVHDGANVFFPDEAFSGVEWRIDETLDTLDAASMVDRVIVVALHARPERREAEYTAEAWATYAQELEDIVLPSIDAQFRTLRGPAHTAVMGSSLGGVVSLWLAWTQPHVFGMAACLSSSFNLVDDLVPLLWKTPTAPKIRVYLDTGWPQDNHEGTREIRDVLLARGLVTGRDLLHLVFPGDQHHESSWSQRVHLPLQFLFGEAFRPRTHRADG
jgi:predicted alpha/beta superfamily hydrolase